MPERIELLTTGYAGHDLDSFLQKLRQHGVERIVDVRQNPVSRKKGFSRTRLSEFLIGNGIGYVHMRELGVPRELREQLRSGECTLDEYFMVFRRYVTGQEAALATLEELSKRHRACLLCVEQKAEECHRSVIAEALAADVCGLRVIHI